MTLGDTLRRARKAAGLTQVELAARLGLHPRTLRRHEHDDTKAVRQLGALLDILGLQLVPSTLVGAAERLASDDPRTLREAAAGYGKSPATIATSRTTNE